MDQNDVLVPLLEEARDEEGRPPLQNPEAAARSSSNVPLPSAPSLNEINAPSAPAPRQSLETSISPPAERRKLHRAWSASSNRSDRSGVGGMLLNAGASFASVVDEYYPEGSLKGCTFNLCSATLGAGCLSVPFAFKGMGIGLGIGLLILVSGCTSFSVHLIIQTRLRSGFRSYGEIAEGVFGPLIAIVVELCVVLFCFGTSVAYCKTLRDILDPVLDVLPHAWTTGVSDSQAMIVLWAVSLLPLSCLRSMSALRFSSLFGVSSIVYVAGCVSVHSAINLYNGKIKPKWQDPNLWLVPKSKDLILNLPILVFAFTCQVNVLDVWDDLSNASSTRMAKVTYRAMNLCLMVYIFVGFFGVVEFGKHTCGNILKSYEAELLEGSWTVIAMYIFIALTLVFAFPLVILPCRSSIMSICQNTCGLPGGHYFWTLVLAGGSLTVSLWVEDVSEVFQLVGASSSALVCFVFPCAAALRLGFLRPRERIGAWLLMTGGVVMGVLGTIVSIKEISSPSQGDKAC